MTFQSSVPADNIKNWAENQTQFLGKKRPISISKTLPKVMNPPVCRVKPTKYEYISPEKVTLFNLYREFIEVLFCKGNRVFDDEDACPNLKMQNLFETRENSTLETNTFLKSNTNAILIVIILSILILFIS
jgi:hypothetical protein